MPSLRAILTRLFGRPVGTLIVPSGTDASTLAALVGGELAPSFAHDADPGSLCTIGWHLRQMTIAAAFDEMRSGGRGRRRAWFRLPKRAGIVSAATIGELFVFGQLVPDGQPTRHAFLCESCKRAVSLSA